MVCNKCGYQNSQDATCCNGCGEKLDGSGVMHGGFSSEKKTSQIHFIISLVILILEAICFYFILINAIIPFLMQGLIMISGTNEALRPTIKAINSFFGDIIHATKDADGIWKTAYGGTINPSCSMASFYRGWIVCIACLGFVCAYFIRIAKSALQLLTAVFRRRNPA